MKHFYLKEVSRTRRKFALISLILPMFGKEKKVSKKDAFFFLLCCPFIIHFYF